MRARQIRINHLLQICAQWSLLTVVGATSAMQSVRAQAVVLTVDSNKVIRDGADRFVGLNLNYIRDADANRPGARPLTDALTEMGTRWLRYPGGGKSDFCLWSQPPFEKPNPVSLGWYGTVKGQRMDFDQYIAVARAVHAEPYIVAGYTTEKASGRTEAQWLENAVAWVRYANVIKKYGVKYWEIGNENWNNGKGTPEELARVVTEFSHAMKAVDPTIRVGASGSGDRWWSRFLPPAAPALDFINLSVYNCWNWKNYDYFVTHPKDDTIGDVETAVSAIDRYAPPADRLRLSVIVSETNSKDYSENGWAGTNTLGHTLVTFDTLGRMMAQPRVRGAMVWTSRWMDDGEAKNSQWYALGPKNEILPTGRALALWGQFVQRKMIAVIGGSDQISGYATCSPDGRSLAVWILNRGHDSVGNVDVVLASHRPDLTAEIYRLSGTGPDDAAPLWGKAGAAAVTDSRISGLSCPGASVTLVFLRSKAGP